MIQMNTPDIGTAERQGVLDVLDSRILADGPEVRQFEKEYAEYCGVENGIATSNGTTALHAALEALGIGAGDTVVTTPFSFIATANSIRLAGARPVFSDIDPQTYNIDPDALEARLQTDDVDAIIAVHLYGLTADVDRLQDLAETYDVHLIEDAAQAHGATYNGQRVGSFGDVACFSFYATKNMTTGEGGIVLTDDDEVATRTRRFINHGRSETDEHVSLGHNFRLTSMQAAIGRAQLDRLPKFIEARQRNAARLTDGLRDSAVTTPIEPSDASHVYHQYTVRTEDRDRLQDHLVADGIHSGVYYPKCIHDQPAYDHVDYHAPIAEAAAREVLSLPVHLNLSENDVEAIIASVQRYDG